MDKTLVTGLFELDRSHEVRQSITMILTSIGRARRNGLMGRPFCVLLVNLG